MLFSSTCLSTMSLPTLDLLTRVFVTISHAFRRRISSSRWSTAPALSRNTISAIAIRFCDTVCLENFALYLLVNTYCIFSLGK